MDDIGENQYQDPNGKRQGNVYKKYEDLRLSNLDYSDELISCHCTSLIGDRMKS